jgi:hypothetical protein
MSLPTVEVDSGRVHVYRKRTRRRSVSLSVKLLVSVPWEVLAATFRVGAEARVEVGASAATTAASKVMPRELIPYERPAYAKVYVPGPRQKGAVDSVAEATVVTAGSAVSTAWLLRVLPVGW